MLIVPRTIVQEFDRNKARIAKESGRSLSALFKDVKAAVKKYGDGQDAEITLQHLTDIDHKIPLMGEAAYSTIARIEVLFKQAEIIEIADDVKARAAQTPFIVQKIASLTQF
jgi:hypothetical protein